MHGGASQIASGVHEGDVIAGKYQVERVLGQGGMGVVVAARHIQLDQKVALKFLLAEALSNTEAVGRFLREARAAVRIMSEHVARVIDVGTLDNGAPYMVMEYLDGGDLAGWLQQRGALPIEQAVEFILQACVAVAEAHALGIVHRDLKPANLFCVRRSDGQLCIKVLDFGISKVTGVGGTGPGMSMTKTSALMGSPLYMSPEQMRSTKGVDSRTDIWALGVVLFELIAGRPPFVADSLMELGFQVASEPPPALRSFRPEVAAGLDAVIAKCLEKDPPQRYRHVGELALALFAFAPKRAKSSVERISGIIQSAGLSASALAVPSSQAGGRQASSGTLPPVGRTTGGAPKGRSAAIGAGLFAALAIAAGAALLFFLHKKVPVTRDEAQPAASQVAMTAASAASTTASPTPDTTATTTTTPTATSITTPSANATSTPTPTSNPTPPAVVAPKLNRSSPAATNRTPSPPPPPAVQTAKHAVDCSLPFTIDSQGHHVPKPECL
jgi:eukaryotic-like serine/threonine-protein kinase